MRNGLCNHTNIGVSQKILQRLLSCVVNTLYSECCIVSNRGALANRFFTHAVPQIGREPLIPFCEYYFRMTHFPASDSY